MTDTDLPPEAVRPSALGPRFDDAMKLASELHRTDIRKGTSIPYISHLLAVAALVIEDGGTEDEAIAALLHDAVEDAGGESTRRLIESNFGEHVAGIVDGCSDTDEMPKPPWKKRKEDYLKHLESTSATPSVIRASLADKLHNAQSLLRDLKTEGEAVWDRFNAPMEDQIWYYRSLVRIFRERSSSRMVGELDALVGEIARQAGLDEEGSLGTAGS